MSNFIENKGNFLKFDYINKFGKESTYLLLKNDLLSESIWGKL